MPQQILTPSGASIWTRKECHFAEAIQHGDTSRLSWRGADWFVKFKAESVNEVIGYRLAEFLGLPVQPWLAVEMDNVEDNGVDAPHVAILVQKWESLYHRPSLERPAAKHPVIVGKALALASLITADAVWMSDAAMDELRLIDLELCGPAISFMEHQSWCDLVDGYINGVRSNVLRCCGLAFDVQAAFFEGISAIATANLIAVIDFTGHSRAPDVTNAAESFLRPAQKMIARILD